MACLSCILRRFREERGREGEERGRGREDGRERERGRERGGMRERKTERVRLETVKSELHYAIW